jgi:nitrous oxide reductase accessory protein NosL
MTVNVTAGEPKAPRPGPEDRCAVCGMYVAKYPSWVASIVLEDGTVHFFDGPKDMFRFLLEPERYRWDPVDAAIIWVTDYYTTRPIAARDAVYVVGSDVMGPMGAELVPLGSEEDARSFTADHGGTATLRFSEVGLDQIPD